MAQKLSKLGIILFSCFFSDISHAQQVPADQPPINIGQKYYNPVIPHPGDTVIQFYTTDGSERTLDHFRAPDLTLELSHLSDEALVARYPQQLTQNGLDFMLSDSNVLGVVVWGDYVFQPANQNELSNSFVVTIPCLSEGPNPDENGNLIDADGFGYAFSDPYAIAFSGETYKAAYDAYRSFLDGGQNTGRYVGSKTFDSKEFRSGIYRCSVERSGMNPIIGNPSSLQTQIIDGALDMDDAAKMEIGPDLLTAESPETDWGVGLRVGRVDFGGPTGVQVDARVNRSFRPFAHSRTLLVLDAPFTYQYVRGQKQVRAVAAASLVMLVSRKITIEPRLAYGFTRSTAEELSGQVFAATIAGRTYFDRLIGRGRVSLGAMTGYTKVTHAKLSGQKLSAGTENWILRGGIAYDLPLKGRVLGRSGSLRASYEHTAMLGDRIYTDHLNEATLSIGLRMREDTTRALADTVRVGLLGRWASHYNAQFVFVGFRF